MKKSRFKALQAVAALEFLKAPGFVQLENDLQPFDAGAIGKTDKMERRPGLISPSPKKKADATRAS